MNPGDPSELKRDGSELQQVDAKQRYVQRQLDELRESVAAIKNDLVEYYDMAVALSIEEPQQYFAKLAQAISSLEEFIQGQPSTSSIVKFGKK
jgi:rubrerythrin